MEAKTLLGTGDVVNRLVRVGGERSKVKARFIEERERKRESGQFRAR